MNKYLILGFVFILIILSKVAVAQKTTYSKLKENTDINFAYVKGTPFSLTGSSSRTFISLSTGIKAYTKGIYLDATYDYQFADRLEEPGVLYGKSVYKNQRSRYGNIMIGYGLTKVKKGKVSIALASHGSGRVMYTTKTKVVAKYLQHFGLFGGFQNGFSFITLPEHITAKDYYQTQLPQKEIYSRGITSYMSYSWFTLGAAYSKLIDVEANFSKYGKRSNTSITRFYSNILISTKTNLDDIYYSEDGDLQNSYLLHRYVLNGNTAISKIGFNVGYEFISATNTGYFYAIELGRFPGIKSDEFDNYFVSAKWGFLIGKKW